MNSSSQSDVLSDGVTIWIPTCARPAFLRTALRSVSDQTARSAIREIIVVENGRDKSSAKICGEHADLPITYTFREVPLAPGTPESLEATLNLLRKVTTRYVAFLFDDDWWMPQHLSRALEGLKVTKKSVASFGACITTSGEEGYMTGFYGSFVPWFAVSGRHEHGRLVLNLADLMVAAQINTSFHYSSLVAERDALIASLSANDPSNPYDTDRSLSIELGRRGLVLCDPVPSVFVRDHPGQERIRLAESGEGARWWRQSTDRIFALAREHDIDLSREFDDRMGATGVSIDQLRGHSHFKNIDYLLGRKLLRLQGVSRSTLWLKSVSRQILPPIFWQGLIRCRAALKRKSNEGL
jgi:glycosyltransferase involved in cell wall biosynthesis